MVTVAVDPAGILPVRLGVESLVFWSFGMPVVLSLAEEREPVTVALVFKVTVLFASDPSALRLPATSENLLLATLRVAVVAPLLGVKVAV